MGKYLLKRFLSLIPVVFIISIILFVIVKTVPGDPVEIMYYEQLNSPEMQRYPEKREEFYQKKWEEMGLNDSLIVQYLRWMERTLKGDLGYSHWKKAKVKDVISEPLKVSIIINIISITLAFVLAIIIGIKSAVKRYSFYDTWWQVSSLVFTSMPSFFIGMGLIFIFPVTLRIFQFGGLPALRGGESFFYAIFKWAEHLFLPVLTLTIGSLAGTIRYVRNAMIEILKKDYIKTARSKGLKEKVVIYSHAFRNALIPVVTIVSGSLVAIFGGSAITESVFAINGIGRLLVDALNARDFSIVLTMNLFYAVLGLLANVIMDISYAMVDPRVKLE
ncbi:MAG TPA: ABC transporter permease [Acholeplasmataceae bacterium]|nr:ABC transporter permease [Acholeplasmataceae bacterium]